MTDHAAAIQHHMRHARACRAVLDRIHHSDHERRRTTVRTMKEHVQQARAHSRAIIATRHAGKENATT